MTTCGIATQAKQRQRLRLRLWPACLRKQGIKLPQSLSAKV